jgi:3-deoxy-D-manno-octulosonic-acid transferase
LNFISVLYNSIFIPFAKIIISVLKPFNKKLKEREESIKHNIFIKIKQDEVARIWFHAASMGEFEQAKPVIEHIKSKYPEIQIIASFFSPSGYNNQKKYKFIDDIYYLPFDTKQNAVEFINSIKPNAAVFVRYEIWRNYLEYLSRKKIPSYLICATRPNSKPLRYFPFLKAFTRSNYSLFTKIYTIGELHSEYFSSLGLSSKITTLSDTRFDRIIENVEKARNNPVLPQELFSLGEFIFVAGSTWEQDEEILIETKYKIYKDNKYKLRYIIVPHEPTPENISRIKNRLPDSILLSDLELLIKSNESIARTKSVLANKNIIVDSIGKLLRLYGNADAAYIGGGFGAGIHSVTEPAGYGIPLATGPKIENSQDASELYKLGALTVIKNKKDFYKWITSLMDSEEKATEYGEIARKYVYNLTGSSKIIAAQIISKLKF